MPAVLTSHSTESNFGSLAGALGVARSIVMRLVLPHGGAPRRVEFRMDNGLAERLRQLRTLVPLPNPLSNHRDLVIDKVRVRLPSAVWRRLDASIDVSGPSLVVSTGGVFHCGAKDVVNGHKLLSCSFPISRLIELHNQRAPGETLYIQSGFFINDEPAESDARRWVESMPAQVSHTPSASSDFDMLNVVPPPAEFRAVRAD